jgi:hypothetical protein
MKYLLSVILLAIAMQGSAQIDKNSVMNNNGKANPAVGPKKREFTCKLTSPELQRRKATVLASIRSKILEKKELPDGYTYKFKGTDAILDELSTFIKTERLCCDFFDYSLKVDGDGAETWLVISGPAGVKDFIKSELEL